METVHSEIAHANNEIEDEIYSDFKVVDEYDAEHKSVTIPGSPKTTEVCFYSNQKRCTQEKFSYERYLKKRQELEESRNTEISSFQKRSRPRELSKNTKVPRSRPIQLLFPSSSRSRSRHSKSMKILSSNRTGFHQHCSHTSSSQPYHSNAQRFHGLKKKDVKTSFRSGKLKRRSSTDAMEENALEDSTRRSSFHAITISETDCRGLSSQKIEMEDSADAFPVTSGDDLVILDQSIDPLMAVMTSDNSFVEDQFMYVQRPGHLDTSSTDHISESKITHCSSVPISDLSLTMASDAIQYVDCTIPATGLVSYTIADYVSSFLNMQKNDQSWVFCNLCKFLIQSNSVTAHLSCRIHLQKRKLWSVISKLESSCKLRIFFLQKNFKTVIEYFLLGLNKERSRVNEQLKNTQKAFPGLQFIVDISNETGVHFVCLLCYISVHSIDELLTHLCSFTHCDAFAASMATVEVSYPLCCNLECLDTKKFYQQREQVRLAAAKKAVAGNERVLHMHETNALAEIHAALSAPEISETTSPSIDFNPMISYEVYQGRSPSNSLLEEQSITLIGVQFLMEILPPSTQCPSIYFCSLCHCLILDFVLHCRTVQHAINFVIEHYPRLLTALLKSSNVDEFCWTLISSMKKIHSGHCSSNQIKHVIKLNCLNSDEFIVISLQFATSTFNKLSDRLEYPEPVPANNSSLLSDVCNMVRQQTIGPTVVSVPEPVKSSEALPKTKSDCTAISNGVADKDSNKSSVAQVKTDSEMLSVNGKTYQKGSLEKLMEMQTIVSGLPASGTRSVAAAPLDLQTLVQELRSIKFELSTTDTIGSMNSLIYKLGATVLPFYLKLAEDSSSDQAQSQQTSPSCNGDLPVLEPNAKPSSSASPFKKTVTVAKCPRPCDVLGLQTCYSAATSPPNDKRHEVKLLHDKMPSYKSLSSDNYSFPSKSHQFSLNAVVPVTAAINRPCSVGHMSLKRHGNVKGTSKRPAASGSNLEPIGSRKNTFFSV